MNKNTLIILIILMSSSMTGDLYRVFVDKEFGFFGVRENSTNFTDYSNHTLYINIGDRVEWENYVATDERVTIVSDNRLWNESEALLSWNYKIFGYTFNKSGTYKVHIKENKFYKPPENLSDAINNSLSLWFNYQLSVPTRYQKIIVCQNNTNNTNNVIQKPKNKIVANTSNHVINTEPEEIEEIVPQITIKVEKNVSPYEKYTILEILKSIFNKA